MYFTIDLLLWLLFPGQSITRVPVFDKKDLDLYRLFNLVVQRGGVLQVVNRKLWREITRELELSANITSAAFTLRNQ